MDEIFELLRRSRRSAQLATDLEGRLPFTYLGIVTRNDDPEGKRRIKCTLQHTGGQTETDWLFRSTNSHSDDPQVPKPGMTVEVRFIDGDPHRGVYCGVLTNLPNPEQGTSNPLIDDARTIEGDRVFQVGNNDNLRVDQNQSVSVGKQLTLQNDAGAALILHESGAVILQDRWGNRMVLGGYTGGLDESSDFVWNTQSGHCNWNLNGRQLHINNPGDVTIAGKSVIVKGSVDTGGNVNNDRGY